MILLDTPYVQDSFADAASLMLYIAPASSTGSIVGTLLFALSSVDVFFTVTVELLVTAVVPSAAVSTVCVSTVVDPSSAFSV